MSIKCIFHDISDQKTCATCTPFSTYLLAWRLVFEDTNNVDDVAMENNSTLNQFRPYFRVLDLNDDYLDHAVMKVSLFIIPSSFISTTKFIVQKQM